MKWGVIIQNRMAKKEVGGREAGNKAGRQKGVPINEGAPGRDFWRSRVTRGKRDMGTVKNLKILDGFYISILPLQTLEFHVLLKRILSERKYSPS